MSFATGRGRDDGGISNVANIARLCKGWVCGHKTDVISIGIKAPTSFKDTK